MIRQRMALVFLGILMGVSSGFAADKSIPEGISTTPHPDHGASFLEQLVGQWVILEGESVVRQLRCYEDGRFGFLAEGVWTAGSYVILRTDERSKGVLRLEYYVNGNLHLQEVRCEIRFTDADQGHDADAQGHHHGEEGGHHHHELMDVETLPGAEQALPISGTFEHRH